VLALVDWASRVAHLAVGDVMSTDLVTSHEGENLYDTLTPRRRDASAIDRNLVVLHLPFHR
jgi:hypothetical protein